MPTPPHRTLPIGDPARYPALSGLIRRTQIAVLGAHGGAGTTTLAALLEPAVDLGAIRPGGRCPAPVADPAGGPLLLACRPTTWSATLATAAVSALAGAGRQEVVLVIVGDGWPQTPVAAARYRLLGAQVAAVTRMPFVPALRGCEDPASVRLPRGARRALARIRMIAAPPGAARPVFEGGDHDAVAAHTVAARAADGR